MSEPKTDDELRKWWRARGGAFHGPNVEHGTMPEAQLLPLLRSLLDARPHELANRLARERNTLRDHLRMVVCAIAETSWNSKIRTDPRVEAALAYLQRPTRPKVPT